MRLRPAHALPLTGAFTALVLAVGAHPGGGAPERPTTPTPVAAAVDPGRPPVDAVALRSQGSEGTAAIDVVRLPGPDVPGPEIAGPVDVTGGKTSAVPPGNTPGPTGTPPAGEGDPSTPLARTGSATGGWLPLGIALLGLGGAIVAVLRPPRDRDVDHR
ncbi:hypothetical protein [Saccharopolyspora sp. CA-218241]|uniref:hypothetical protein n=1 Tax=Saccharopolyspora sp. CA-218241 TaxID=3240027 RepID=UPI003D998564